MELVIDSTYKPLSFQELIQPFVEYKKDYEKIEEDYSNLVAQTETWRNIANREKSPEAFEMFSRYANQLNAIVDDFSQGMNPRNRSQLLAMKRGYASNITPIATAHAKKEALAEEQRKARLSDPTLMWEHNAEDMSLDDFIRNPNTSYGKSMSGRLLTQQVSEAAAALAKEYQNNPEKLQHLGTDFYEYVKSRGFSSDAILDAIKQESNASPVLTGIVNNIIGSSGILNWADPETIKQAYNYARQGLWGAVGADESQIVANWRAQEQVSHANTMARQRQSQQYDLEKQYLAQAPIPYITNDDPNTVKYYSPIKRDTDSKGAYTYDRAPIPKGAIFLGSKVQGELEDQGKTPKELLKEQSETVIHPNGLTVKDLVGNKNTFTGSELANKGFKLVKLIIPNEDGGPSPYEWGTPGEDSGKLNRTLRLNEAGEMEIVPKLDKERGDTIGYAPAVTQVGSYRWGMFSNSNAIGNSGNFIKSEPDDGAKYEYVSDLEQSNLDAILKSSIDVAFQEYIDNKEGTMPTLGRYEIFKIKGSDGRYSYAIMVPQQ